MRISTAYRTYLWVFAAGLIVALTVFPFVNFVLDPFRYYGHRTSFPVSHADIRKVYAGLLTSLDYDALIVGSSYSENFLPSEVSAQLGHTFLRPALSGSSAWEQATLVKRSAQHKHLKYVLWELRPEAFGENEQTFRNGSFPLYLYEETHLTHVRYLFSIDTLWLAVKSAFARARFSPETSGTWYQSYTFGPTPVRRVFNERCRVMPPDSRDMATRLSQSPDEVRLAPAIETFRKTVLQVVDNNKDVDFAFYLPPYSMYKYILDSFGGVYVQNAALNAQIVEELMSRENVTIYDFQAELEIISDFSNYKDTSHFGKPINDIIINAVKQNRKLNTFEDFHKNSARLTQAVIAFSQTPDAACNGAQ